MAILLKDNKFFYSKKTEQQIEIAPEMEVDTVEDENGSDTGHSCE